MILQSLRLMKKRKNNCYKHSPSFYFANVCSLSPSCLLNGNGSFSQLPVQNNYKISALSFAFFGVALSASPSAALTLNASLCGKDTKLHIAACPVPHAPEQGIALFILLYTHKRYCFIGKAPCPYDFKAFQKAGECHPKK